MRPLLLVFLFGLSGCSLERAPLVGGLDTGLGLPDVPGLDVPGLDAPRPDTPELDAPLAPDAGDPDVPQLDTPGMPDVPALPDVPMCVEGTTWCDGETLETCRSGSFVGENCTMRDAYCESGACVPRVCTPDAITCSGAAEQRCDARGSSTATSDCTRGCTHGTGCNPETACALRVLGTIRLGGMMPVNTCGAGNETQPLDGCVRTDDTGSDVVIRLEVPVRANYRIEAQGDDPIDPVLYVRTACATRMSQLDCDDDDAAGWGARIDITLDPGDYFLMVDSFRDGGPADGRCGAMNVVVTTPP